MHPCLIAQEDPDGCTYCSVRIDWLRWSLDGVYAQLTVELDTHPTGLSLLCAPDQFLFLAPFLTQQPLDGHLTLPLVQGPDGALGIDWAGALEQHQLCLDELRARPASPAPLLARPTLAS